MAGSNRSPAPNRTQPPSWGSPEADPQQTASAHHQHLAHEDAVRQWAQQRGQPLPLPPQAQHHHPAGPAGHPVAHGHVHDPYAGYARPEAPTQPPVRSQPDLAQYQDPYAQRAAYATHQLQPQPAAAHGYGHPAESAHAAHEDSRNWDLSHYSAHATHQGVPQQAAPGYQQPHGHYPQDAQWHPGHAQPAGAEQYDQRYAYADQQGYAQPGQHPHYADAQGYAQDPNQQHYDRQDGQYAEHEAEDPAPRSGPRPVVVIAALVGAIAAGGALAYGYRTLGGGKVGNKPPVVKAESAPAKTKPADAGGKEVAHTDKKFVNRLGDQPPAGAPAAAAAAPTAPADPEAPRKVTTLIVNKDGTITPQAQTVQPTAPVQSQAAQPSPPPAIPGMVVEGLTPRAQPRSAEPPVSTVAKAPPVSDLPLPKTRTQVAAPTAEPKAEAPPPKKKPAARDDLAAPKAAAATSAPAAGGTVLGFVPVLASKKTREEAQRSFNEMFQRFPDVLAGKSPDVIEANLQEKGVWFRTVVGPPGSREAAREICNKLDAQGFKGCWVTAFRQ